MILWPLNCVAPMLGCETGGGEGVENPILKHKRVLALDGRKDVLAHMERDILSACPECQFDWATDVDQGFQRLLQLTYDLVIMDTQSPMASDLARPIAARNVPVLALSENGRSPELLNASAGLRIQGFSPGEDRRRLVPMIEQILRDQCVPWWKRTVKRLLAYSRVVVSHLAAKGGGLGAAFPVTLRGATRPFS
jgi:CheY-like chemotaxis protein